jgi:hypothetical protein
MRQNSISTRIREIGGKKSVPRMIIDGLKLSVEYGHHRIFKSHRRFVFNKQLMKYFYFPYNATWRNERAIEIPIIRDFVLNNKSGRVLEFGNVLSHYFDINHDIIDKYEKGKSVLNEDIVKFKPLKKYDLIVAISTLEHVGWDEKPREPAKILDAVANLRKILNKGGSAIISVPLGYNSYLDKLVHDKKIFDEQFIMKRVSGDNLWREVSLSEVKGVKYGKPFPFANAVVFGLIKKGNK